MNSTAIRPEQLVGTYRTFGEYGPLYQVVSAPEPNKDTVHVLVIESGEELDYPVEQAIADPEAE